MLEVTPRQLRRSGVRGELCLSPMEKKAARRKKRNDEQKTKHQAKQAEHAKKRDLHFWTSSSESEKEEKQAKEKEHAKQHEEHEQHGPEPELGQKEKGDFETDSNDSDYLTKMLARGKVDRNGNRHGPTTAESPGTELGIDDETELQKEKEEEDEDYAVAGRRLHFWTSSSESEKEEKQAKEKEHAKQHEEHEQHGPEPEPEILEQRKKLRKIETPPTVENRPASAAAKKRQLQVRKTIF